MKKRLRHVIVFKLFRPFFRIGLWIIYRYKAKNFKSKTVKGPYLVLGNHTMNVDPFLVALSFNEPIFFVASDMLFSIPVVSKIITYLVQPISKSKYKADTDTVKNMIKVSKSGGSIGIFPEGNRTFSGATMNIPYSTVKLIKHLKVPVLFYRIKGGYLSSPRWSLYRRRGKLRGYVHEVWTYEQYKDLSNDEIYEYLYEALSVNDFDMQKETPRPFKGKNLAEYIERAFFVSPETKKIGTIYSSKNEIFEKGSSLHLKYNQFGIIENLGNTKYFDNTIDWFKYQQEVVTEMVHEEGNSLLYEDQVSVYRMKRRKRTFLSETTLSLYKDRFTFTVDQKLITWYYKDILPAVQYSNVLIGYNKLDEDTLFFKGDTRFSALKYVMFAKTYQRSVLNYDSEL